MWLMLLFYCFYAKHVFTLTSFTRFNLRIEQQIVLLILSVTAVPHYCCQLFNLHRPNSHVCSDWSTVCHVLAHCCAPDSRDGDVCVE